MKRAYFLIICIQTLVQALNYKLASLNLIIEMIKNFMSNNQSEKI